MKPPIISIPLALGLACSTALAQPAAVHVDVKPQNGSGESGTATLIPEGDGTRVELQVNGEPAGASQPAHLHEGTCAHLDPKPKYGLENVVGGKSVTKVPVSEMALLKGKHLAVNVHKSAAEAKTYVACGDIDATTKTIQ